MQPTNLPISIPILLHIFTKIDIIKNLIMELRMPHMYLY